MYQYILNLKPTLISFYTMCNSFHNTIEISKMISNSNKDIKIVFGGPHASLCALDILNKFDWIDGVGIGEGEKNILNIVDSLLNNKSLSKVEGFAYKDNKNNYIVLNKNKELIENLDELPFINYELINLKNVNSISLDVGRGCPFACKYCSTKTFWKRKFRLKSSERIIKEIKFLHNIYNKNKFDFIHDLFTVNKFKIIDFCDKLKKENLNIKWSCSGRIDTLNEDVIKRMSEAGCSSIFLGIETGSKFLQKDIKLDNIWNTLELIRKYNIDITMSFIYGFPNEDEEDLNDTIQLIRKAINKGFNKCQLHLLTVLSGTELYGEVKDKLYYSGKHSDLTDAINIENCKDIIINNKNIFPQFFDFKTNVREKYRFLDRFISLFYSQLHPILKTTFSHLESYYKNDILNFYLDFINYHPNFYERLYSYDYFHLNNIPQENIVHKKILLIKDFIYNHNFNQYTDILKTIIDFELDCFLFLNLENSKFKYKSYNYNLFELNKCTNIDSIKNITDVNFYRLNNDKIKIKKVTKM